MFSDIEAHAQELQSRSKVDISEKDRIRVGESGFFDADIYGGEKNRFDGYVTSIATNDEIEEEDVDALPSGAEGGRRAQSFTAPKALLDEIIGEGENVDPFAEHRRPTIADREDEYRAKRRKQIISPERADPFADGLLYFFQYVFGHFLRLYCTFSDRKQTVSRYRKLVF